MKVKVTGTVGAPSTHIAKVFEVSHICYIDKYGSLWYADPKHLEIVKELETEDEEEK